MIGGDTTAGRGLQLAVLLTALVPAGAFAGDGLSLVRIVETSTWAQPSPDPSGLAWDAHRDRLVIVDSEIDELKIFAGANLFVMSRQGGRASTRSTVPWSREPSGIAYAGGGRPRFFVSDDDVDRLFIIRPGTDGRFWTSDDARTRLDTRLFGSSDPEGLAWAGGRLVIADGHSGRIVVIRGGRNGRVDGAPPWGDDLVTRFDTTRWGVRDPEGIEYVKGRGTLFVVSRRAGDPLIEVTLDGRLVKSHDIDVLGVVAPSGLAWGHRSSDSARRSLYLSDRGVDNGNDPDENDGRIFELAIG